MSWSANGRKVAFLASARDNQLRLLAIGKPGSNAEASSTAIPIHGTPVSSWDVAEMTPDGKSALISYAQTRGRSIRMTLGRFSLATGTFRQINTVTFASTGRSITFDGKLFQSIDNVLWASYDGSKVIVQNARPGQNAGIYTGTRYTPLAWPANVVDAAW